MNFILQKCKSSKNNEVIVHFLKMSLCTEDTVIVLNALWHGETFETTDIVYDNSLHSDGNKFFATKLTLLVTWT